MYVLGMGMSASVLVVDIIIQLTFHYASLHSVRVFLARIVQISWHYMDQGSQAGKAMSSEQEKQCLVVVGKQNNNYDVQRR